MDFAEALRIIPEYPRTVHLPHKPNVTEDDLTCTPSQCSSIWTKNTSVTEKVDGAQCRMGILDGYPLIGNRNYILNKSYRRAKTASKMQFSSIFGWWYKHKHLFDALEATGPYSVYGEWMYMQHGMHYDILPNLFLAYDVYDYNQQKFIDSKLAHEILEEIGFSVVPFLYYGPIENFKQLEDWCEEKSLYSSEKREGVYLKVCDKGFVIDRFKMVRPDFEQGKYLDQTKIIKNGVI